MFCSRCGQPVQPGQRHCSCGQFTAGSGVTATPPTNPAAAPGSPPPRPPDSDLPEAFYQRLETQVSHQVSESGKTNFRQGLIIGLGFLLAFLLLETAIDALTLARATLFGLSSLAVVILLAANLIWLAKRWLG